MSVGLVCPRCSAPITIHRAPVLVECPTCKAPLPDTIRESAELSLMRQRITRPMLLSAGMYVAPAIGGIFLYSFFAAVFDAGGFTFTLGEEQVSGGEFLRSAGLLFATSGILLLLSAYAIWRERPWGRWPMAAFWVVSVAGSAGTGLAESGLAGATGAVAATMPLVLLAMWYLFSRQSVVDYYQMLEREADAATARASSIVAPHNPAAPTAASDPRLEAVLSKTAAELETAFRDAGGALPPGITAVQLVKGLYEDMRRDALSEAGQERARLMGELVKDLQSEFPGGFEDANFLRELDLRMQALLRDPRFRAG